MPATAGPALQEWRDMRYVIDVCARNADVTTDARVPATARQLATMLITQHEAEIHDRVCVFVGACFLADEDPPKQIQRPPIPPELRAEVYARDGHRCLRCGTTDRLSLDHIVPFSCGGQDTLENLRTLCRPCNASRGIARWEP